MTVQKTLTQSGYISIDEVATNLGVGRTNVYYYVNQLKIKTKKFSLDRKTYISNTDFERIKVVKAVASGSARIESEDVLVFLANLGLAITPHSDPELGFGYVWFGGDWNGPYPTTTDAIKAAFETADKKAQRLRDMPFPTQPGELHWWDGEDWFTARHKDGELQIRTFSSDENEGYEPVENVQGQHKKWLQPLPPTGDEAFDDERSRARLAARILYAALNEYHTVSPINWQRHGLQANVHIDGVQIGRLLSVYNHFRKSDHFMSWLDMKLASIHQDESISNSESE